MEYHLYGETQGKTYYSSALFFDEKGIMITDTQNYLDDDGCWEEYYAIKHVHFNKLLKKLEAYSTVNTIENLDEDAKTLYDSLDDDLSKKLFLSIHSIFKTSEKPVHGFTLVEAICSSEIPYEKSIYS
jgi:hypothetical protein